MPLTLLPVRPGLWRAVARRVATLSFPLPLFLYACPPAADPPTFPLVHTPVLWAYWPRMMVARLGQQSALETKAFEKLMPSALSTERVFGMYLRSSFRMSSVRMKTMLGLALSFWVSLGMLPETLKESSAVKAIATNGKKIFFMPHTSLEKDGERKVIRPPPLHAIAL